MMFWEDVLPFLRANGGRAAYTDGGRTVTYREMLSFCAAYFDRLCRLPKGTPVVLYGHKEPYMRQVMLACLFAAVPYVPLDSSTPQKRLQTILRQVQPGLWIGGPADVPCPQMPPLTAPGNPDSLYVRQRDADDVCYILFTSGSSGVPKGVCVSFRNLDTCIRWLAALTPDRVDCVLNQANYSFDLSVADLYLSLYHAARHEPLLQQEHRDFARLFSHLRASGADTAVWTPSFVQMLLRDKSFSRHLLPNLRTILLCGEALPVPTAQAILHRFPGVRLFHCYGPTECTFAVTAAQITQAHTALTRLPAGTPKPGVRIIILGKSGETLPEYEQGEICIVGDSVALGYLPPAVSDPFFETDGLRAYRTGDSGCLKDGQLYVFGRMDRQIKLSGYRVEPAEIEQAILSLPHVSGAAVVPLTNADTSVVALQAFAVCDRQVWTAQTMREALGETLPPYMIPRIRFVPEILLTENGKADVRRLTGTAFGKDKRL